MNTFESESSLSGTSSALEWSTSGSSLVEVDFDAEDQAIAFPWDHTRYCGLQVYRPQRMNFGIGWQHLWSRQIQTESFCGYAREYGPWEKYWTHPSHGILCFGQSVRSKGPARRSSYLFQYGRTPKLAGDTSGPFQIVPRVMYYRCD